MFGQFYARRDLAVAGNRTVMGMTQLDYAQDLLAELLNRAMVLDVGANRRVSESGRDPKDVDYVEKLEALRDAVGVFMEDIDEARTRALRVRLVTSRPEERLVVSCTASASDSDLEWTGGALVAEDGGKLNTQAKGGA